MQASVLRRHGDCHDETSESLFSARRGGGAGDCWRRAGAGAGQARRSGRNAVGFNLGYFAVKGMTRASTTTCCSRICPGRVLARLRCQGLQQLHLRRRMVCRPQRLPGGGRRRRLLPAHGAQRLRQKVRDDGREIAQELKLRIVPVTGPSASCRSAAAASSRTSAPASARSTGATARPASSSIDDASSSAIDSSTEGTAAGPVVLGGIRFPVATCGPSAGKCAGRRPRARVCSRRFLGDKIDLGGWTTSFTVHLRF